MKKHISLNISGIIFHVEEDAFEMLKSYLNDISKHFSSFSGSEEVMADIERRIAEFFLDRLSVEKEYLTKSDVEDLKLAMGSVTDQWEEEARSEKTHTFQDLTYQAHSGSQDKKLYRDEQRRLVAGVASGIAHYFSIDPLWIRLAFLLVLLDFGGITSLTGIGVMLYIALWIAIPGSFDLEENDKLQRLFRDPDDKVLGGVASGVASYFNIDPTVVRVVFALSTFAGGLGLLSYIILWIITPEAKSLTDRMQMKGEPITLANIEQKIKDSLHIEDDGEESTLARILLFPFRMIALGIDKMKNRVNYNRAANTGVNMAMLLIGGGMVLASTAASLGMFGALGVYFGLPVNVQMDRVPLHIIRDTIPLSVVLFTFIAAWVPVAYFGVAGMSIASRRVVTKPWVNWGLLLVWLTGIVGSAVTIPMFASNFNTTGAHKAQMEFAMPEDNALRILVKESRELNPFDNVKLTIVGHDGSEAVLVQKFEAQGCSRQSAIQHASHIQYEVEHRDSTLIFNPKYALASGEPYRNQKLYMELRVPYGKEFAMSEETRRILRNTIYKNGYTIDDLKLANRWVFEEEGLRCLTCEPVQEERLDSKTEIKEGEAVREMVTHPINAVKVDGIGELIIRQGAKASVTIMGNRKAVERTKVHLEDDYLRIRSHYSNDVVIEIVQPNLESLTISGPISTNIESYRQENFEIRLSEAASLTGKFYSENLVLKIAEGAKANLQGACANFIIKGQEGARVNTEQMSVENMTVQGEEGTHVTIGYTANLHTDLDEGSHVYRAEK